MLRTSAFVSLYVASNWAIGMMLASRRSRGSFLGRLMSRRHKVSDETLNGSQKSVRAHWHQRDGEHEWLEEVDGVNALKWVRERNALSIGRFGKPEEKQLYTDVLKILESKDKIPAVWKMGDLLYNFWEDDLCPRGLLRRTTSYEFAKQEPAWETVLDIAELGKKEGESWVYKGMDVYRPDDRAVKPTRILLSLSRGGADATVVREFDLQTLTFVEGGFVLPESKSRSCWLDQDTLLIGTDLKDGQQSMTDSGYPRTVRQWKRGTPLAQSTLLAECAQTDMYIVTYVSKHKNYKVLVRHTALTFYTSKDAIKVPGSTQFVDVPKQDDASCSFFGDQMLISLRSDWACSGATYVAGSLLAVPVAEFLAKATASTFTVLFAPSASCSLYTYSSTLNYVVLTLLEHVKTRVCLWKMNAEGQSPRWVEAGTEAAAAIRGINMSALDKEESDDVWLTTSSFIQPTRLSLVSLSAGVDVLKAPKVLKSLPDQFDATGLVEIQDFAISKDGTRVPYFLLCREDVLKTGNIPTVLYGYGGFEISLTPSYAKITGKAWLEQGGCWVVSNIRGGGEYGPEWHKAALRERRENAYDDFIAVAEDLIAKGVTSSKKLAIYGGSNGGLLMGNILTRRPELFRAVICSVPLLDMQRYSHLLAGASWMAEYGNPDVPSDWQFLQCYSAYHNIALSGVSKYPELFMFTSTRDDRVHPYHARSFVARLLQVASAEGSHSPRFHYYENIEGGHGGAADCKQSAFQQTLYFSFLNATLRED